MHQPTPAAGASCSAVLSIGASSPSLHTNFVLPRLYISLDFLAGEASLEM